MISFGGMGEVRRVWDRALNRTVALKALRSDLAEREDLALRFLEEAQATAQLEHPGIVPIYEVGRLPDGRPFFTMKEIRGRTLLEVIEEVHAASSRTWQPTASGWTFARLVQVFHDVCETVAYAHSRGVLHRDLKPTNVMVGAFGEVVVMDWGLVKVAPYEGSATTPEVTAQRVVTSRSQGRTFHTRTGSVTGTPNYMSPEQARGDSARVGPWSDVYALGSLLYEILSDRPPYEGPDMDHVVAQVLEGPPPPPVARWADPAEPSPEDGLRAICARAMSREIADRYMDAEALGEAVADWLDSASARERAITMIARADLLEPEMLGMRSRAATLRTRARARLDALPPLASADEKRPAWALEDQAEELELEFRRKEGRYVQLLQGALATWADLPEARARLEALEDPAHALLHSRSEPGYLSLATAPTGARVTVEQFVQVDRRLVPQPLPDVGLGPTPLDRVPLPAGSYRLTLHAEGRAPLVWLARVQPGDLWGSNPPGTTRPIALALAPLGADPIHAVRIPAGWCWLGGDREVSDSLPRSKVWVPAFLIHRHPVTAAEYLAFLSDLEREGKDDDAATCAPTGWTRDQTGWRWPEDWTPAQPVRQVSFDDAAAYAAWVRERTGERWRLPREHEWEKAARGVDERRYPWGEYLEPSWCCTAVSHATTASVAEVDAYPEDISPWGVRGLGGNVRDWVVDERAERTSPPPRRHRLVKGGWWLGIPQFARCALRYHLPVERHEGVGFRLVLPLD
jgi:serine/threonine-protein kinase